MQAGRRVFTFGYKRKVCNEDPAVGDGRCTRSAATIRSNSTVLYVEKPVGTN